MIDFRYHVVSIAAIFIALAMGIALGAGPLKGPVDSAISQQTEQLRKDREQLRSERDAAAQRLEYTQAWVGELKAPLVQGQLVGKAVTLLVAPETPGALVTELAAEIGAAGGQIVHQLELAGPVLDPTQPDTAVALGVDLVIVVAFPPVSDTEWNALTPLLRHLATSNRAVVSGSQEVESLVPRLRADSDLASQISTVDTGEFATGQVSTVLAAAEQLRDGVGHYGYGEGAQAAAPELLEAPA